MTNKAQYGHYGIPHMGEEDKKIKKGDNFSFADDSVWPIQPLVYDHLRQAC